ncbi:MAG: response regulator [Deltaproteobacteria bacterium]|nr:response regulator [Deltaproteobacteria bacterium]
MRMNTVELEKILYVEDDDDIRILGEMALRVGPYEVISCSSGPAALKEAAEQNPDLIIMDVMMPGMDGPSALKALGLIPSTQQIPVIFMTAKVQPEEIEAYKKMGAVGVISKPFDPMTLAGEVENIWKSI